MPQFEFCIPTTGKTVPSGPDWFHEIKFDGYRLRVERDGQKPEPDDAPRPQSPPVTEEVERSIRE